jgi:hypothetical protein
MRKALMPVLVGALSLLLALPQNAPAQGKGKAGKAAWDYLGEANVDGAADHDRITVTRTEGTFRAIQLRVERAPIEFNRVVVHYSNGQSDPVPVRERIAEGGASRAIDLPGQRRAIQSVEIWYERAKLAGAKPRVTLYGRR